MVRDLGVGVILAEDCLPEGPIGLIILVDLVLKNLKKQSEDLAWLVANREFKTLVNFIPIFGFEKQAQNWLLTE